MDANLAAASLSLQNALGNALAGGLDAPVVALASPAELGRVERPTLAVWLYRVTPDAVATRASFTRSPTERSDGLMLRLHYLLVPLAPAGDPRASEVRQRLLGRVCAALARHPVLGGPDLLDALAGSGTALQVRLEDVAGADGSTDPARGWDIALGCNIGPVEI